jgi:4'-phosphopantetheinyl transferase
MDIFVAAPPDGEGSHGLSAAQQWLASSAVEPGAVICLGVRFDGYTAGDWKAALHWLIESPEALVSATERSNAARYLHSADAVRHLAARSLLRHVYARHGTGVAPEVWPVNPWGKPGGGDWPLHFNLSHSGSDIWMACTDVAPLGIDVESATPDPADLLPVVHPDEAADLRNDASAAACQRLWVRKEAVVKALGEGLSQPLDAFRVTTDACPRDWLLTTPATHPGPWTTHDLPGCGNINGALAARGRDLPVTWRLARVLARRE